jgi:hypothetical protein
MRRAAEPILLLLYLNMAGASDASLPGVAETVVVKSIITPSRRNNQRCGLLGRKFELQKVPFCSYRIGNVSRVSTRFNKI